MKKIIIIMFAFLLSGCSVNYELTLSEDLSITEEFSILNDASYYSMIGEVDKVYKTVIDSAMKDTNYINYNYIEENNLYGVHVDKKYASLEDYKKYTSIYKRLYDDIEISTIENITQIKSVGEYKLAHEILNTDVDIDELILRDYSINMKVPFKVIMHNADRVDKQNNIYYWDMTKDTTSDKSMEIEFDTSKKFVSLTTIISKIDYTFVIIIAIILVVLITYTTIKKKNEENNKI